MTAGHQLAVVHTLKGTVFLVVEGKDPKRQEEGGVTRTKNKSTSDPGFIKSGRRFKIWQYEFGKAGADQVLIKHRDKSRKHI